MAKEQRDLFVQLLVPLLAGGIAGTTVDMVMFPVDTIKTRLQSSRGFWASGGFRRIYAGIIPAAAGSAPSAATFFCTYELVKASVATLLPPEYASLAHMMAASFGEVMSCLVRVPFELVKQRAQVNTGLRPRDILRRTLQSEGVRGLYRGYFFTVAREVPFSFIQYPLWEYFKGLWGLVQGSPVEPFQSAICGALAGGCAAAVTTPLDVAKTRIMLAMKEDSEVKLSITRLLLKIGTQEGVRSLFSGFVPRVTWISIGGFVFLGAYDKSRKTLLNFSSSQ